MRRAYKQVKERRLVLAYLLLTAAMVVGFFRIEQLRSQRLSDARATTLLICQRVNFGFSRYSDAIIPGIRQGEEQTRRLHIPGFSEREKQRAIRSSEELIRKLQIQPLNCRDLPLIQGGTS